MTKDEIINHTKRISNKVLEDLHGPMAEAKEFLKTYGGSENHFYKTLLSGYSTSEAGQKLRLKQILDSFAEYVENDLLKIVSQEREIQIETVSDYLEQAESLLNDNKVHPAAPAVIIGSSLEEFLRNWLEEKEIDMSKVKPSLDSYCQELRKMDLILKQDVKDIISWGGIRNDAAHGHWDSVSDRNRIKLMLEGVNLFMRKYSK